MSREASTSPQPAGVRLLNNLICGNRLGEIDGPALDATDSGNLTPSGSEGLGVAASPGCEGPATVYASPYGGDGQPGTSDDDFELAVGSPAIDGGLDPRTLGLAAALNSILEADYQSGGPVRPHGAAFDIGAREGGVGVGSDTQAPTVIFQAPAANAHVRQTVTVIVQAEDAGSGVAAVSLSAAGQALVPSLTPGPSAPAVIATATWDTTTAADGAQTLSATATDAAGQSATVTRGVVVDNTPPDTDITGGPSGPITIPSATFSFTGSDNLTSAVSLEFAWRLDGGAFSAFTSETSVTLSALAAGPHTFEVKARDRAGNEDPTPAVRGFTVTALSVTISEPANGATVTAGRVLVRGTVTPDSDVTVFVNDTLALVQGTSYSAFVTVEPGTVPLTAIATMAGASASASVTLNVVAADPNAPRLRASPPIGTAPLAVRFALLGGPTTVAIELDLDGNGTVDFTGPTLEEHTFTYTMPGAYLARVTVTDDTGVQFSATTAIFVIDGIALDGLLRARWTAMKDALRRGAIEEALTHVALDQRDMYRDLFTTLSARLPAIDQILTDITFVEHQGIWSEYEMVRMEDGLAMSYFILFVLDEDGLWRIEFL